MLYNTSFVQASNLHTYDHSIIRSSVPYAASHWERLRYEPFVIADSFTHIGSNDHLAGAYAEVLALHVLKASIRRKLVFID